MTDHLFQYESAAILKLKENFARRKAKRGHCEAYTKDMQLAQRSKSSFEASGFGRASKPTEPVDGETERGDPHDLQKLCSALERGAKR